MFPAVISRPVFSGVFSYFLICTGLGYDKWCKFPAQFFSVVFWVAFLVQGLRCLQVAMKKDGKRQKKTEYERKCCEKSKNA